MLSILKFVFGFLALDIAITNGMFFRWVCASIDYPSTVTTAIVRFTHPAYGFMLFRQESGKPRTDTTVFGELANLVSYLKVFFSDCSYFF